MAATAGSFGLFIGPAAIGALATSLGLRAAIGALVLCAGAIAIAAPAAIGRFESAGGAERRPA